MDDSKSIKQSKKPLKHSGWGIASLAAFIISFITLLLISALLLIIVLLPSHNPADAVNIDAIIDAILSIINIGRYIAIITTLLGIPLAFIGLMQRNRKKLSAVFGITANGVLTVFLILLLSVYINTVLFYFLIFFTDYDPGLIQG